MLKDYNLENIKDITQFYTFKGLDNYVEVAINYKDGSVKLIDNLTEARQLLKKFYMYKFKGSELDRKNYTKELENNKLLISKNDNVITKVVIRNDKNGNKKIYVSRLNGDTEVLDKNEENIRKIVNEVRKSYGSSSEKLFETIVEGYKSKDKKESAQPKKSEEKQSEQKKDKIKSSKKRNKIILAGVMAGVFLLGRFTVNKNASKENVQANGLEIDPNPTPIVTFVEDEVNEIETQYDEVQTVGEIENSNDESQTVNEVSIDTEDVKYYYNDAYPYGILPNDTAYCVPETYIGVIEDGYVDGYTYEEAGYTLDDAIELSSNNFNNFCDYYIDEENQDKGRGTYIYFEKNFDSIEDKIFVRYFSELRNCIVNYGYNLNLDHDAVGFSYNADYEILRYILFNEPLEYVYGGQTYIINYDQLSDEAKYTVLSIASDISSLLLNNTITYNGQEYGTVDIAGGLVSLYEDLDSKTR